MKRFRKVLWFLIRLTVSGAAIGLAALWVTYWDAARGYDAELKRAEGLGLSVHYSDLDPQPPVRDADNAGPLYRAAMKKADALERGVRSRDALIRTVRGSESADWTATRETIAVWSDVIKDVEVAAAKPRCHFTRDWNLGSSLPFPELADLRWFTDVLCARALLEARDHDPDAAFKSLGIAAAVSRHTGEEPVLIAMLVRNACETRVISTINRVVDTLGPSSIEQARMCLASFGPTPELYGALRSEVAFQFNAFDEVDHLDSLMLQGTDSKPWFSLTLLARPPLVNSNLVRRAYQARILKRWNDAVVAEGTHSLDPRPLAKALDVMSQEVEMSHHPSDVLAKIMFPVFSHAGNTIMKLEAQKRMLAASFDLRAQRARDGHYPATAAGLPLDPFDGKPLRYKREKGGFLLYSVGYDLKDNGGRVRANILSDDQGVDVALTVPG